MGANVDMVTKKKQTILLIEDDSWLAELEETTLTNAGYSVLSARYAQTAIESIDAQIPDVIVLDVLLDGASAFTLLNELQSHDDTQQIPIILCTNLAEQFSSTDMSAYGIQRVVNKTTMHPDDLVAAVRTVLP